jgi:hypothetical protein
MLIILPCAGHGTRMGMKEHEAKELLPMPHMGGKSFLQHKLDLIKHTFPIDTVHIITRQAKKEFNKKIKQYSSNVFEGPGDWQASVLSSKNYWQEKNLLILPDTQFDTRYLLQGKQALDYYDVAAGCHFPVDLENWSYFHSNHILVEKFKPIHPIKKPAWIYLFFTRDIGEKLFSDLSTHKKYENPTLRAYYSFLSHAEDLTRGTPLSKNIQKTTPSS